MLIFEFYQVVDIFEICLQLWSDCLHLSIYFYEVEMVFINLNLYFILFVALVMALVKNWRQKNG